MFSLIKFFSIYYRCCLIWTVSCIFISTSLNSYWVSIRWAEEVTSLLAARCTEGITLNSFVKPDCNLHIITNKDLLNQIFLCSVGNRMKCRRVLDVILVSGGKFHLNLNLWFNNSHSEHCPVSLTRYWQSTIKVDDIGPGKKEKKKILITLDDRLQ